MMPLNRLTHELSKLPGIGQKTAQRLALFILRQGNGYSQSLAAALQELSQKARFCSHCFHVTDVDPCRLCTDMNRDHQLICVVEDSSDLFALERTHSFRGVYHILQGALSPLDGIGVDELRIRELMERVQKQKPQEVILATNPNVTGDATALYLSKVLKPLGTRITRLAAGIPVGGEIEYADQMTLSKALEARREF